MIFWLLLLGIFTYFIVRRSVANVTKTPVWLLWLVMMLPAFVWTGWAIFNPDDRQIPLLLLLLPFVFSSITYLVLVQRGRITRPTAQTDPPSAQLSAQTAPAANQPAIQAISREEEAHLQNCFPWSVYYLQNIEHKPQALICKGQLRTSPDLAYKTIAENVKGYFADRFLVVFQEGLSGKPFFALVPNPQAKAVDNSAKQSAVTRPLLALGLLVATLLTTSLAGVLMANPSLDKPNLALLPSGLPYALALLAILGTHELGHYLAARHYRIQATLPYFIPVPPLLAFPFGTFGAFIQIRSHIPNRKALFDVGLAGPLSGFIMTLPILVWGLAHSTPVPLSGESGLLNFESFKPTASLLLALLSKLSLGAGLGAETALRLHPVAIAGCLGLVITALNLMPVGQLDGGHIVHAMFGQRRGANIGQVARLLLLLLAWAVQYEFRFWAILLLFMPVYDEPALNDVSELDNGRDVLGLLALAVLVMIILPAPSTVTRFLF
ncbi:MAG: site-2 protease family protein [Pegethrix bostrychoides GSE-TBD4-15B]|jgi:membrane-associated protease RseP (regulator of RpoE activity)|uniref:Site-2 protease family protein n=1 Tax=Pegethrix bostrychoides GSE-TBD4-15B TaxID=2839662 RepID=A0A951PD22_9CYAN|nr:site-2 protease family protein [Pegethrix bostrychoides GSE-TBD4-15B]